MNDVEKLGDNFHLSILSIISSILCCPVVIHMIKLLGPCMGKDKMELTKSLEFLPFCNEVAKFMFFTGVCLSTGGGGAWSGGVCSREGAWSGGVCSWGDAWSGGMPCLGGLLQGGGLLLGAAWYPSMHWGRRPRERRLLLRTVRILLECILVPKCFHWIKRIQWQEYLSLKGLELATSCVRDKDATTVPTRHV